MSNDTIDIKLLRTRGLFLIHSVIKSDISRKLLILLEENPDGLTVTDMYIRLRCDQSVCSQHLARFRRMGLVSVIRSGKNNIYSPRSGKINLMKSLINAGESFLKDVK